MPPRKVAANSGEKDSDGPKAVEFRILDAVLKTCTPDDKPKSIDFELMTKKLGFKNIVVAKKRWSQVCKSNGWYSATGTGPATSSAGENVGTEHPAKQEPNASSAIQKLEKLVITQDIDQEKVKQEDNQVNSPTGNVMHGNYQAVDELPRQKRIFREYSEDP
ncbi:hypothetical protein F4820DRAFT_467920 [Hypoxylon rubiginosum]|uniref:Uncharacterized protein n=1 Tax=Hypoxylon rubiginosum TaxID=110542 RepID=A0ACB9YIS4_9PEZI|nr:hypothetical protein F4820DRAFT_467920 [Hypoxylon rubiginosum]